MIKHLEIKTYEYCGISVTVSIDYDRSVISLMERKTSPRGWDVKKWVFAERGLDFMNCWQTILDAMKYAVEESSKELKGYKDAKNKEKEDDVVNALSIATDIIKNKNAKGNRNRKS